MKTALTLDDLKNSVGSISNKQLYINLDENFTVEHFKVMKPDAYIYKFHDETETKYTRLLYKYALYNVETGYYYSTWLSHMDTCILLLASLLEDLSLYKSRINSLTVKLYNLNYIGEPFHFSKYELKQIYVLI